MPNTELHEYIDGHREEINRDALAVLRKLDGTPAAAVTLLAGVPGAELDQYGGMPDPECR